VIKVILVNQCFARIWKLRSSVVVICCRCLLFKFRPPRLWWQKSQQSNYWNYFRL